MPPSAVAPVVDADPSASVIKRDPPVARRRGASIGFQPDALLRASLRNDNESLKASVARMQLENSRLIFENAKLRRKLGAEECEAFDNEDDNDDGDDNDREQMLPTTATAVVGSTSMPAVKDEDEEDEEDEDSSVLEPQKEADEEDAYGILKIEATVTAAQAEVTRAGKVVKNMKASEKKSVLLVELALAMCLTAKEKTASALQILNSSDLKAIKIPQAGQDVVFIATMVLLANVHDKIPCFKSGKVEKSVLNWNGFQRCCLENAAEYLEALRSIQQIMDAGKFPVANMKEIRPLLENFDGIALEKANGITNATALFVTCTVKYYDQLVNDLEPSRRRLAEIKSRVSAATNRLRDSIAHVKDLERALQEQSGRLTSLLRRNLSLQYWVEAH